MVVRSRAPPRVALSQTLFPRADEQEYTPPWTTTTRF